MKRNIVIATLTAATLAGGAVAAFAVGDDGTAAARPATAGGAQVQVVADRDDADTDDRAVVRAGGVTAAEAIEAALRHTPGTVVSAELDDDGADAGAWSVDVVRDDGAEYDVQVSGAGKVLGAQRDTEEEARDSEDRAELAALKGAEVDARGAAVAAAAKGTVVEVGGDDDGNGAVVWGVETVKEGVASEWKVALATGEVTKVTAD